MKPDLRALLAAGTRRPWSRSDTGIAGPGDVEVMHGLDEIGRWSEIGGPNITADTTLALAAVNGLEELLDDRDAAISRGNEFRKMLADVLASAHPNERDHPAMSIQWERAKALLRRMP